MKRCFGLARFPAVLLLAANIYAAQPAPSHLQLGANVNESLTQLEPGLLDRSHTTWVRGFLPASEFISGQRSLSSDEGIQSLKQCARDGRKVIVSIKWDLKKAGWRVPTPGNQTETQWFAWVDALLNQLPGQIAILSLVNEVSIDTEPEDLQAGAGGQIPMVRFLQRLAAHVSARHPKAPDGGPLPLYCGGFTRLDTRAMQTDPTTRALIRWSATDPQIAGIDFHLHQSNYQQFSAALNFLRDQIPDKPFIVTEYSLVWEYKKHLNDPLGGDEPGQTFCAKYHLSPALSVLDFINRCLKQPVPESEWNHFLQSRKWFDPNFLTFTSDLMRAHGVIVATYALSQKSSGGTKPLRDNSVPWLLNPIFVSGTAQPRVDSQTAVNTAWFDEYLQLQPKGAASARTLPPTAATSNLAF